MMDGGVMGLCVKGGSGETAGHFINRLSNDEQLCVCVGLSTQVVFNMVFWKGCWSTPILPTPILPTPILPTAVQKVAFHLLIYKNIFS